MKKSFINCLLGGIMGGILVFGITTHFRNKELKQATTPVKVQQEEQTEVEPKEEIKEEPKEDIKAPAEAELSNGNFVCGKDFKAGTYDVIAVKDSGNVSCMENGFIAVMGTKESNKKAESQGVSNMFQSKYSNIEFKEGDKLKVDRVTIKLIKK